MKSKPNDKDKIFFFDAVCAGARYLRVQDGNRIVGMERNPNKKQLERRYPDQRVITPLNFLKQFTKHGNFANRKEGLE